MSEGTIGGPCRRCGQQGVFNCCEELNVVDHAKLSEILGSSSYTPISKAVPGKNIPLRFRTAIPEGHSHPNGSDARYRYGVYFPATDLVVGDMGGRGTGKPNDVEWLDENCHQEN